MEDTKKKNKNLKDLQPTTEYWSIEMFLSESFVGGFSC